MSQYTFLLYPFLACVILTGIHTYLGMHVIARGIIFVDISLAQIAALGMTVALLTGLESESQGAYFISLSFTFFGAFFFAFFKDPKIPQEAIIGVAFAFAQALSFLIADKIPHGSEHISSLLNGNILWVNKFQLIKTATIYSLLGLIHFFIYKKLWLVSSNEQLARDSGLNIKFWDLIFYLGFGLVITSSVQIGGILLVFAYLIVPALISQIYVNSFKARLFLGWLFGIIASLISIVISFKWDTPTGSTIVVVFGICLIMSLILKKAMKAN